MLVLFLVGSFKLIETDKKKIDDDIEKKYCDNMKQNLFDQIEWDSKLNWKSLKSSTEAGVHSLNLKELRQKCHSLRAKIFLLLIVIQVFAAVPYTSICIIICIFIYCFYGVQRAQAIILFHKAARAA